MRIIDYNSSTKAIECIDPNTNMYRLTFSPFSVKKENSEEVTMKCFIVDFYHNPTTKEIQDAIIATISEYETNVVNKFILNGVTGWFSKDTRLGFLNSISIEKEYQRDITTLWINNVSMKLSCDSVIKFLKDLEIFAIDVFNTTKSNISAVSTAKTRGDIVAVNITANYPNQINVILNS